jgi:hypothetical protein
MLSFSKKDMDFLLKLSEHCRECKHTRLGHTTGTCIAVEGTTEQMIPCGCEEFVPEDNLDYIEWLAKKRGLIK